MSTNRRRGRPAHPDVLTPAEWRVAEAVRHGLTNRAIAERMGVSADAVKFHVANALSKLGLETRRDLRRWDGVRADTNLAREPACDSDVRLGAIGQVGRYVSDLAAARRWYAEVLGLRPLFSFDQLAFFDCGGTRLMLTKGDPGLNSILYFDVPDIRTAHARLEARGASFIAAPHLIHRHDDGTEEWMSFFNDCDERPLAIMSRVPKA